MFNKTLIAAALTVATFGANAATVITNSTGSAAAISNQGLPATKAYTLNPTAGGDTVVLTLKATDNSSILSTGYLVVTVSGALFTNPATATADVGGALVNETVTVNTTLSTSTKLVFDLNANADDWTVADNDTIEIANVQLQVTGSDVKFSSIFQSPTKIDQTTTAGPAVSVAKATDQWKAAVTGDASDADAAATKLDAKIDVGDNRETFVGGVATDTMTFDIETSGSGADENEVSVTIDGDFAGVKSVVAVNGADSSTYTINTAKTQATYTYTGATATTATEVTTAPSVVTFTLETAADKVSSLAIRDFDLSVSVNYDDAEGVEHDLALLSSADAGNWSLNGVTETVEYVPYGPNTQIIMQATSTFGEDASVSVSYLNEATGKMVTLDNVATVKANAVTKLGGPIAAAIMADSGTASGKTRVVLTINAPNGKVSLFNAFKDTNDMDRLGL